MIYNRKKGIRCILGSALSFSAMNVMARLAGDIPVMQKTFFRNVVAMLVIGCTLLHSREPVRLKKGTLKLHLLRSLFGTLAVLGNFYAVDHMLLSDATMLVELSPFFIIMFSALILREKATTRQWISVVIALCGAVFVIKPSGEIFSGSAALVALLSAAFAGVAYTMVRVLNVRGENGKIIIFFFSAFSCLVCLPSMVMDFTPFTARQFLFLLGAALCGCAGQFFVTAAYRYAPGAEISIFDYSQIVFSALFGWIVFFQMADVWSYLGYGIIISDALWVYFADRKASSLSP